jgi:beta-glucanase (GH16 family)
MTGKTKQLLRHTSSWLTRCLIALVAFTCMLTAAQTPIWSEEFNYNSAPDSDVWSYDLGNWGWGNQELQNYTSDPANVWVNGSNLVITAIKQGSGGGATFTSARIKTLDKLTFKYGTVEARIQTPDLANGLWPAFWTLGNNFPSAGWPGCGEIDIMEMGIGGAIGAGLVNQRVGSHFHWDNNGGYANWGDSLDMPSPINDTFVVYRMEWTPTAISTYINGIHIVTMNTSSIPEFNAQQFFILNMAVGGAYTGIFNASGITAAFPAEYKVDWIRIYDNGFTVLGPAPPGPSTPYSGTPMAVPGTIEAENYDNGGENSAYHDVDGGNSGNSYRSDGVDIEACTDNGGGFNVGWTEAGEWLKYTVDIASAGDYTITTRVASQDGGGAFHIEVDDVDVTGSIPVGATGGWQGWVDKTSSVTLGSGEQVVKLVIDSGGMNINRMEFVLDQAANSPPVFTSYPISKPNATEDSAYSETLAGDATDPDSDPLSFSLVPGGPAWLSVATNGVLSGTPGDADAGPNSWTVQVTDGINSPALAFLEITVDGINYAPVFTNDPIVMPNALEGTGYVKTIAGSATDADPGDTLTYSWVSGPAWLNVATNGMISGLPGNTDAGLNSWKVQVTDGIAAPVSATLEITVESTSPPPPALSILVSGPNLEIMWPSSTTGFSLYSSTNLVPPVLWSSVTNAPIIQGDDWMVVMPLVGAPQFFRLENP